MAISELRTLGRSGLVVSPLALGAMTFGATRWGADDATARAVFDAYLEAGGNFIDTADVYGGGASEEMLGRFVRESGARDRIVLSTKSGYNAQPGNPHAGGNGAKNIHRALDQSLRRLGVDCIDLYWLHVWDGVTPAAELLQTLGDLVRGGRIRYFALSDMPAWFATKVATLAEARGVPGPVALQVEYSLAARDVEREHVPAARDGGMAVVPWSPLAGGFLTGKYSRTDGGAAGDGRLAGANPFGATKFTERNWGILDVLRTVAAELDRPPAQTALAWVMQRPGVTATLIGASRPAQLLDNLAASEIAFTADQLRRLNEVSAPAPGFSDSFTSAGMRQSIFGGHPVAAWEEQR